MPRVLTALFVPFVAAAISLLPTLAPSTAAAAGARPGSIKAGAPARPVPAKTAAAASAEAAAAARAALRSAVKAGARLPRGTAPKTVRTAPKRARRRAAPRGSIPWTRIPLARFLDLIADLRGRKLHAQAAEILEMRIAAGFHGRLALELGRSLLAAKKKDDGLAAFLMVYRLSNRPKLRAQALHGVARCYDAKDDRHLARAYHSRVVKTYPKTNAAGGSLYFLGVISGRERHWDQAMAYLRRSANRHPRSGLAHLALMELARIQSERKRNHFGAVQTYLRVVKEHKIYGGEALYRAAYLYDRLGQSAKALPLYKRLARDYRYHPRARYAKKRVRSLSR